MFHLSLRTPSEKDHARPEIFPTQEAPEPWPSTLAGAALFLIFGLVLILSKIPHNWLVPAWFDHLQWLFGLLIVLPAAGFSLGWIKNFPRWSMPYIGLMFLMARFLEHASTPGLHLFNYPIFGRELWGWRAWIPALTATLIALLIARSVGPLFRLFGKIWRDWTLLTFGMFSFMPWAIGIGFDEVGRLFSLPFMVVLTVLMVGTVIIYFRSPGQRPHVLLTGTILVVTITALTPTLYWAGLDWGKMQAPMMRAITVILIIGSPWLIGLLRRVIGHRQPVKPNGPIYE